MEAIIILIYVVAFLYSVMLHEIAHGWVAYRFGDDTAKVAGRLSLNPLVHIDPIGSILVPLLLIFSQSGFLFGWAKPVPVNPSRLRSGAMSYRFVSLAGITTNLILAVISAIILKVATQYLGFGSFNLGVVFFQIMMEVNIVLAVFNLLPFPGFDGFSFLYSFKPIAALVQATPLGNPMFMMRYGLLVSILLLFILLPLVSTLLNFVLGLFITIFGLNL